MTRYLLLMVLVWVLWRELGRPFLAGLSGGQGSSRPAGRPPEILVRCATCGIYIPDARAVVAGGGRFCSAACCDRSAAQAS
jgi:hypothetical protein